MKIKVFFNNSCNLCRYEINHYKKIADSNLEWIDITNNDEALKATSKTHKELLRRLKRNETAKKKSTNSRKRKKRTSRARLRKKVQPLVQRKTKSGQSENEDGSAKIKSIKWF